MSERRKQDIETLSPLSPLQQGMLFHALELGEADPYLYQYRFEIDGELDRDAFRCAWEHVVLRHQALRADYRWEEAAAPLQIVFKHRLVRIEELDWRGFDAAQQDAQERELLAAERRCGFDFRHAADLRLRLIRRGEQRWHLLWSLHHIVLDGWSAGVVLRDVLAAYQALREQRPVSALPAPRYTDYVDWLLKQDRSLAANYWGSLLQGCELPTPLPLRSKFDDARYAEQRGLVDAERSERLSAFARHCGVTLNTLIQSAWALLLARHADTDDVLFGVTVSGRAAPLPGIAELVGLCINTVPLRISLPAGMRVRDWLLAIQSQGFDSRQHEAMPLPEIQRQAAMPQGQALFDSILVFENYPVDEVLRRPFQGLSVRLLAGGQEAGDGVRIIGGRNNYALSLIAVPGRELSLTLAYRCARFSHASVALLLRQLQQLLLGLMEDAQRVLSSIALPDACEGLTGESVAWGDGDAVSAFRAQWARSGTALAAQDGSAAWTRAELEAASNRLSAWLRSRGVAGESRVALCAERSLIWLSGVLGIFKSGGVWVALDPQWPAARVCELAAEAGAELILSRGETAQRLQSAGLAVIDLDTLDLSEYSSEPVAVALHPHQAAYLIYTSGSTGKPKGVTVSHGALAHYAQGFLARAALPADASLAMISTTAADLGHTMLFGALFGGHALHLIPTACAFDADRLAGYLSSNRIDVLKLVPSHLRGLLSAGAGVLPEQLLVLGGEASRRELIEQVRTLKPGLRILNHYGPTETTVGVLTHEVNAIEGDTIPTGLPLPGTTVHVLDRNLNPVPQGVTGELYIGGPAVARGYWNRPELTAERFIPDPQGEGRRLYRSGDRVRLDPQGRIEFLGRADEQIKIRGNRIELGEVERALRQLPNVRDAAVVAKESEGRWQLLAYAVSSETGEALQAQLRERLPEAMLPAHLITLEQLPLTPNGKLDRKALPDPDRQTDRHAEPETELERQLAAVWKQVLKIERVGRHDHFFALGGDSILSLQVIALARRQGLVLSPKLLLGASSLADLARQVDSSANRAAPKLPPIPQADRTQPLPLSYAQQRLWFLWKLDPDSAAYNIPSALRLKGAIDEAALQLSFDALLARHESLRTVFGQQGEQARQAIRAPYPLQIQREDLGDLPSASSEASIRQNATDFIHQAFDLECGPLLRAKLLRVSDGEHILLVVLHHIVADGWSMNVVVEEFAQLYEGFRGSRPAALPPCAIQYADYALWQRRWLEAGERERQLAYWVQQLAGEQALLKLPTDHPRPAMPTQQGARLRFELDAAQLAKLKTVARRHQLTVFMLLLAAFKVLLYRYTGQKDLRVGIPVANRHHADTQRLVGFFVNTQVIRSEVDGAISGQALFEGIRKTTLAAQLHQDLPFEQLVEALQPERSLSHNPLFQVMMNHRRRGETATGALAGGLQIESLDWETQSSKFDLSLDTAELDERIVGAWTYRRDLFEPATIERLSDHWHRLLGGLLDHPERRIGDLPMLDEAECRQLAQWNATGESLAWTGGVQVQIEAQARLHPDRDAVVMGERALSYAEVNGRANRLAHALSARGIGAESKVGLLLERRPEMIVGLLAILKAGAAYVPLDPDYPRERLDFMLEDSGSVLLLTQQSLMSRVGDSACALLDIDADYGAHAQTNPPNLSHPDHLAYVIYTSGSTGTPKGVMLSHRSLQNYLHGLLARVPLSQAANLALVSTIAADLGHTVLFGALASGRTLHVLDAETAADAQRFHDYAAHHRLQAIKIVPGHLSALLAASGSAPLPWCCVVLGGEACPPELVARLKQRAPQCRVFNHYGPTETTVGVLLWPIEEQTSQARIPIGRPLSNSRVHVLDENLQPLPIGAAGELYIGGAGLARGYLSRAAQTADRFVPDPFDACGGRLYRSGDRVRRRADGAIEYLGRIDQQLKIRGFRVEPGEIESALRAIAGVQAAVVLPRTTPAGIQLAVYVAPVSAADAIDAAWRETLRRSLRARLPDYLVPAQWRVLERLPLTRNGKPDLDALARLESAAPPRQRIAARTPMERAVADIWAEVLKCEVPGVEDNFFELGGHSLAIIQVQARLRQATSADLPIRALFQSLTVESLAAAAEAVIAAMHGNAGDLQSMSSLLESLEG